jgi:molybdopterin synthase catalytic subunit
MGGPESLRFSLGEEPLALEPLLEFVSAREHGAVAAFLGVVRERSGETPVRSLAYTAYADMALAELGRIGEELQAEFGPLRIAARHRLGELAVGEASIAVAVGSPHRREAFAALARFMDRLKETVPIWKEDLPVEEESDAD